MTGRYTRTANSKRDVDISFVRALFARVEAILADMIALFVRQSPPLHPLPSKPTYIVCGVEDVRVV